MPSFMVYVVKIISEVKQEMHPYMERKKTTPGHYVGIKHKSVVIIVLFKGFLTLKNLRIKIIKSLNCCTDRYIKKPGKFPR